MIVYYVCYVCVCAHSCVCACVQVCIRISEIQLAVAHVVSKAFSRYSILG